MLCQCKSGAQKHKHDKTDALYVAATFKNGDDDRKTIEDIIIQTMKIPDQLTNNATEA